MVCLDSPTALAGSAEITYLPQCALSRIAAKPAPERGNNTTSFTTRESPSRAVISAALVLARPLGIITVTRYYYGNSRAQAQSLPGIMRSAFPSRPYAFYDFFLSYLANASDPRTGYFPGQTTDNVTSLGGAFHFYKVRV